ncbi:tRNA synthetases class I (M)-domain-containing protein [Schizophyllum amplum]|uniref:methionine--tRNA ligase n=1 Tax=Schizophyllum amplum TaxID=97359 RepID=A0A550CHC9_9AGAR|nr:tRNA synthetases class I (M)-domain-containing protein [Auriculariopsis ampla]
MAQKTQKVRQADGILRDVPDPGHPAILPKDGERNVLITSALPYCNNVPHLGNIIGSTLSADVFSRYNRTRNRRTLYVCGTDEYGTATETQALKEGISPKELCDKYHALHVATYEWFNLGFDYFGRTSTPWHTTIAQEIFANLYKNGFLEKQDKEQTYCEGCPKFLADRFVEGTCPHCGFDDARGDQCDGCSRTLDPIDLIRPRCLVDKTHVVTRKISSHMYLKLNAIQPKTEEWIKAAWKKGKWSPNAVINSEGEIIDPRLKSGLVPTAITRDLTWGVPVPVVDEALEGMKDKVLYVWFDAPIGYPSITANYTPEWKQWWFNPDNVDLYQFMGKDNVYFHTVYFPSVELADGRDWTMLHHVSTTEFLNYESGKFSKSKNRGVFGPAAKETGIPADVWRYYLLSTRPETGDAMFSWSDFIAANNGVLLNNFGNFVNRALKFVTSQYDSVLPDSGDAPGPYSASDVNDPDAGFIADVNSLLAEYTAAMEAVKLRLGLSIIMTLAARGNGYLQASKLGKALMAEEPKRCAQVVSRTVNLIYVLSVMVYPYMPATSERMLAQLNAPARVVPDTFCNDLLAGHVLGEPEHLFKRIEESQAEVWRARFGGSEEGKDAQAKEEPKSKRAAKKAQKAEKQEKGVKTAVPATVKTPAMEALEERITEQGQKVRDLKAGPKTAEAEAEIKAHVEVLKGLKGELEVLQKAAPPL